MVTLEPTLDLLPHQAQFLATRIPDDAPAGPIVQATLGGWGSGKTFGVAIAFMLACLRFGWHIAYGRKRPQAVVMAPNLRLAKRNQLDLIDSLLPPELVRRRWSLPEPRLLLANGVEISAISADANYEGENLVACWCDEIQHELYANSPERYTNMVARLRDPRAKQKHTRMFVSGLPLAGFVRETFEIKKRDPTRHTRLWSMSANTLLPEGMRDAILKATPAGMEASFIEGQWMNLPDALYPQFREDAHVTDDNGNRQAPVDIGLDAGNRSAAVIAQRKGKGVHVVDEVLGDGLSVEELVERTVQTGWMVQPGKSSISVDPTLRRDEMNAIFRRFPGVSVVQRERSEEYHDVWRGVRLLQACLRNSANEIHLTFARKIARNQRGVVESFQRLRINPRTGGIVVDDQRDHPNDACRYLVCTLLGRTVARPEVIRR